MNAKSIIYGLAMFGLIQFSFGQGVASFNNSSSQLVNSIDLMSNGKQQSIATFVRKPPRKVFGSYHIFDKWENHGVIGVSGGKEYKIRNINVNVKDNRFESKASKDSIFAYDRQSIDYMLINNRKFKNLYLDHFESNKICEVIVEDDAYMVLKVYKSDVNISGPDPLMLKPDGDEYVIKSWYYIKRGEKVEKFKLNKKNILGLFSDKKKEVEGFVKKNKLSWNKPEHFKQMYLKSKTL